MKASRKENMPPSPIPHLYKNVSTDLHSKEATYIRELISNDLCKASICPKLERLCNEDWYRQNSQVLSDETTPLKEIFLHVFL